MIEYILTITITIIILLFAYIKIKYPFWNNQPVFHTYDYWRQFYSIPFIIYKYRPIKTKYCDFDHVKTKPYLDIINKTRERIVDMLQCYYINTDRILHTIQIADIDAYLTGHGEPAFISIYNEPRYQVLDLSNNTSHNSIIHDVITIPIPLGCITSRPVRLFYHESSLSPKYTFLPIYYIDYLCVHRSKEKDYDKKQIYRKLLQTHEYNQRIENPTIVASLIKKEIDLFDGVVPLVEYTTYTFLLRNIRFDPLPPHFEVIQINNENSDILFDFLDLIENQHMPDIDILVMPDIGNLLALIKQRLLFVYCLRSKGEIYGLYFIKDMKMQYEDVEGNTLQVIGSVTQLDYHENQELFYMGFLHSLRQIVKKSPEYKMIHLEKIGHNVILLRYWMEKHSSIFMNKTAYYTYNFIYPRSPISNERCIFLL
jgi:hypothetical protein